MPATFQGRSGCIFDSPYAGSAIDGTGAKILCKETMLAQSQVASNLARYAQQ
jgi:hypothetical protein